MKQLSVSSWNKRINVPGGIPIAKTWLMSLTLYVGPFILQLKNQACNRLIQKRYSSVGSPSCESVLESFTSGSEFWSFFPELARRKNWLNKPFTCWPSDWSSRICRCCSSQFGKPPSACFSLSVFIQGWSSVLCWCTWSAPSPHYSCYPPFPLRPLLFP